MTIRLIEFEDYYINPNSIIYIGPIRQSIFIDVHSKPSYYYSIHFSDSNTIEIDKDTKELAIASRKTFVKFLTSESK